MLGVELVGNGGNVGAFDKHWGLVKRRGRNGSVSLGWNALIVQEGVVQWLR